MKVSIIMPVYNSGNFIEKALISLAGQTYSNWELIVVDDGSEDNSMLIVHSFKEQLPDKCIIVHSEKPKSGAGVCRNIGLLKATGNYVLFFDSDDVLEPFCLQQRVKVMSEHPKIDWAVFNQYAWYPEREIHLGLYNKKIKNREEAIQAFLLMQSAWQTMAVLWKKATIDKVGGFDASLYFMEDPDLHVRALLDEQLVVVFQTEDAADCYYRMPALSSANAESFYANSINGRFGFLKKMIELLPQRATPSHMLKYLKYIRLGFINFVKTMLFARLNSYSEQFEEIVKLLTNKNILSDADNLKLQLAAWAYTSKSKLVPALRLRGLVYRLL